MAGRSIRTFTVLPHLPERLQALHQLAYNLWWCWNHEAVSLFRRIDDDLFGEQVPTLIRAECQRIAMESEIVERQADPGKKQCEWGRRVKNRGKTKWQSRID